MKAVLHILLKEVRDNLRDRRSFFFALIYGPILMPMLIIGPLVVMANKNTQHYDTGRTLYVHGAERAPNLLNYLKTKHLDAQPIGRDFKQQIRAGEVVLVLEVAENYGEQLLAGEPATLTVHYLTDDQESRSFYWQLTSDLQAYNRSIANHRMLMRGFDAQLLQPIDIVSSDLAEDEAGTTILANMTMFLIVFACMMGGFYLAVDIISGEREHLSLEPLLSLALPRWQIVLGKYLAIVTFCVVSMLLPMVNVAIWTAFLPENFYGDGDVPTLLTWLKLTVMMLPVCLLISSLLMAIAAFSKSTKEAQTQLGFASLLLMAPFGMVQFMDLKLNALLQLVPILGHYLLADRILLDASYSWGAILPGALSSVVLAFLLLAWTTHLYRQDGILNN